MQIKKCLALALVFCVSLFLVSNVFADKPSKTLVAALIQVESGGDDGAIGDKHLRHKAYGCLQIRKPCLIDVNKAHGTDYTPEDCLNNRELSIWVCESYIDLYATEERLGRKPTDQDKARIFNAGPNGYKKASSEAYWVKVKEALES